MFINLLMHAWSYDFCFHIMPRCLMSPTRNVLCIHTQRWPASWNQNLTLNYTAEEEYLYRYQCFLIFVRGRGTEMYFKPPVCVHTCYHIPHMIRATDAWHLCKSNWHLDHVFFSFPIQCCSRNKCAIEWERCFGGRKALKPFLLFVPEPRFSSPLSFLFHDIVCFLEFKA